MTNSTTAQTPLETLEEFVRTYNLHDREANHALISPSFVRYGLTTGWQPMGFDSYKDIFEPFKAAFPDFKWELTNVVASGDWVSAQIIETGTFKAPSPTGPTSSSNPQASPIGAITRSSSRSSTG
jgi:predicted ester cyclase